MAEENPLRVAVVGSGPAGFYATGHLLAADTPVDVDLIDRLPTPWGLVRTGVAPDHPKIKAVSKAFEKIASKEGFRFLGNVDVGKDVSAAELRGLYDAVVYSVGAQTDRSLGIPGEDLPGSWAATEFVAWYNGHPDYQDLSFDLSGERAVVIGNGNVAVDVARMLALNEEELASTDTTDEAIAAILGAGITEILMLGRRGPVQGAFTPPEVQELGEMADADILVDASELALDPTSEAELAEAPATTQRNIDLLNGYTTRVRSNAARAIKLRFFVSPVAIHGDERVEAIEIVRNKLELGDDGRTRAVATSEREMIPCGIVFRSVGYRGVPLEGVPFDDDRATMRNDSGRVLDEDGVAVPGVYCAGWIKRGPTGVIGTNKKDATETADHLLEDAVAGRIGAGDPCSASAVDALLAERGVDVVTYAGWEAIDALAR
ncbi:MAG: FAD-dependent oxidoreductase, partial [Gaiellaceae bacterium]